MIRNQSTRGRNLLSRIFSKDSCSFGGYGPKARCSVTAFNVAVSLVLIFLSSPLYILLALIIKLKDGGPVIYKGTRLGCGKRPYTMYKFRTLPVESDKIIGSRLFASGIIKINYLSKILRDSRLDELPQLFNILKGDMDFIGPRPERPEIYEKQCKDIPDYDIRFLVKPGMIGYSQLFTPHSTPKRLRSLIDNRQILRPRSLIKDIYIILYTSYKMIWMASIKTANFILINIIESRVLKKFREKRLVERIRHLRASVYIKQPAGNTHEFSGNIILFDINDFHFRMHSNRIIDNEIHHFILETEIRKRGKKRFKRAHCEGQVIRRVVSDNTENKYTYIVSYKPLTELNRHMVDRYFLKKSFA
jgi:lipopolysaccharide/colanic/teichoic acid biosynthesis glycosyltransferase